MANRPEVPRLNSRAEDARACRMRGLYSRDEP
jgi:hypothetical protein